MHRSDLNLIISSFEYNLLISKFNFIPEKLMLTQFYYKKPTHTISTYDERVDFAMLGHFKHGPNRDSVHYLKNTIWPIIQSKLPSTSVHIYGANPTVDDLQLTEEKIGFIVNGVTKNQFKTLSKHRILLVPLRYGAGIKGKIADSWYTGTPVISTSIGAEGMASADRESDFGGIIADTPETFAKAAVLMYNDERLWQKYSKISTKLSSKYYSEEDNIEKWNTALNYTLSNKEQIRANDIIYNTLWSQGTRSTEWKSKYLALKTRLEKID